MCAHLLGILILPFFFCSLVLPISVGAEMGLCLVLSAASCNIISLHRIWRPHRLQNVEPQLELLYLAQVSLDALMGGTEQRSDRETVRVLFIPDLRLFHQ